MKKGLVFLGGVAAGFLLAVLAVRLLSSEIPEEQSEADDDERRIAEWGVGS